MLRQRLVRLLLPLALLALVAYVAVLATRPRVGSGSATSTETVSEGPRIEGFSFTDLVAGRRRLEVQAKSGVFRSDGGFRIEGVERALVDRENASPLTIRADRGAGSGAQGQRIVRLEGGVRLDDPDQAVRLELPSLEIDQSREEVRSLGAVVIRGETFSGNAASVVYGLKSQPTTIRTLTVDAADDATLRADVAVLRTGSREIELTGSPAARRGNTTLSADAIALARTPAGKLERAVLTGNVVGRTEPPGGIPGEVRAAHAEVDWGPDGEVARVLLEGSVAILHGEDRLDARTVTLVRPPEAPTSWTIHAEGEVRLIGGETKAERGTLRADVLDVTVDGDGNLQAGDARGNARFESPRASGEAPRQTFSRTPEPGSVSLVAEGRQRARVASGRTRIVADRIDSDPRGTVLVAKGRVEATLLPEPKGEKPTSEGMFRGDAAVHFLSETLDSLESGERLTFRGGVRGWQGERNLSADRVDVDKRGNAVRAEGRVATRFPKRAGQAAAEADLIRVSADALDYGGKPARAIYSGNVKVTQVEGTLETDRLDVAFGEDGGAERFVAAGNVRFNYVAAATERDGKPADAPPPTTGKGDRAIYETVERIIRLFGDKAPAEIRRGGAEGGLTTGRVLRYRMDTGSLEVESADPSRSETPVAPR